MMFENEFQFVSHWEIYPTKSRFSALLENLKFWTTVGPSSLPSNYRLGSVGLIPRNKGHELLYSNTSQVSHPPAYTWWSW